MTSEFTYDPNDEAGLAKELTLQVRKVIGPFAAPKKIFIVSDLPKTRSGKVSPIHYLTIPTRMMSWFSTDPVALSCTDYASYHA